MINKNKALSLLLAGTFLSSPALAEYSFSIDDLGTSKNIKWTETSGPGDNTVKVELPDNVTRYFQYEYQQPAGRMVYGTHQDNTLSGDVDADFNGINSSVRGGAITNYLSTIGNITGDFINNYLRNNNDKDYGAAIYNSIGTIGNITGDFVGNYLLPIDSSGSFGGAIFNDSYSIGDIMGNFVGNYVQASGNIYTGGGAINNFGIIGDITGNFIANRAQASSYNAYGGAIYNSGNIGDISGDFINNYAQASSIAYGGAIYNSGSIGDITGNFVKNYAQASSTAAGGAIYNSGSIGDITGNFDSNYTQASSYNAYGGAIYNSGIIGDITGNFTNNYAQASSSDARGGAIYNSSSFTANISGNFINNYTQSSSYNAYGGAIYNYENSPINIITGNFIGNYAQSSNGHTYGGAIYNKSTMYIKNSSFINNHATSATYARGGAIYNSSDLTISADGGDSLFSGNYVEENGVKTSNAIYMSGAKLNLSSVNSGTITFDDGIDGTRYDINVSGDGSGEVVFNNKVTNVKLLTLAPKAVLHLGTGAEVYTQNMNAVSNPNIKLDVDVDRINEKITSSIINVADDVKGSYELIVNALSPATLANPENASFVFLKAPNDTDSSDESFAVSRVIGSPYMWKTALNLKNETQGSTWYLHVPGTSLTVPEVVAGVGLHEAAIEQTRSVVRNVRNKVAAGPEYCPNCGVYSIEWDGKTLRNAWVQAQGETATIDKPVKMGADIWGVEAGFDIQNDVNNTLGVFASYRKGEYDLNGKGSKIRSTTGSEIDIDSYLAGLYYRYDKNLNWLFATVYGGVQKADVKTDDKIAKFDTDGVEFGASVEAGHTFALSSDLTLDPSLGLYYTQIDFDKAKDNIGKEYSWKNIKHLEAELGAKLEKQADNAKIYVKPSVIQTITGDENVKITGLNKLSTYKDSTLGRIELGGRYGFTDALSTYGWANYTFGSNYDATAFGAGINYAW